MPTAPVKPHQREPTTYRCWSNPLVGEERHKPLTYYYMGDAVLLSVQIVEVPTSRYRPDAPVAGIDHVDTVAAAVFALGELGLNQTAKRVAALIGIQRDSPDEPEVNLDSLKRLVRTMQSNPGWGEPLLAVRGRRLCACRVAMLRRRQGRHGIFAERAGRLFCTVSPGRRQ